MACRRDHEAFTALTITNLSGQKTSSSQLLILQIMATIPNNLSTPPSLCKKNHDPDFASKTNRVHTCRENHHWKILSIAGHHHDHHYHHNYDNWKLLLPVQRSPGRLSWILCPPPFEKIDVSLVDVSPGGKYFYPDSHQQSTYHYWQHDVAPTFNNLFF